MVAMTAITAITISSSTIVNPQSTVAVHTTRHRYYLLYN